MRSAEAICVNGCIGTLRLDDDDCGLVYFDHGEAFLNEIYPVWVDGRRRFRDGWAKQIEVMTPIRATISYPLQAADLMAWNINHADYSSTEPGVKHMVQVFGSTHIYYDLDEIEKKYTVASERRRAEGISRAKRRTRETRALEAERRWEQEQRS